MPQVSLTTSTNYSGSLNALVEDQGTELTVRFNLDEPAPAGGLRVFVDSNVEQIVSRLDLPNFTFNPVTENINPASFRVDFDNSGFAVTINEGATSGSFTIPVFNNPEPEPNLPETFDGLVEATFSVKTADQVAAIDQGDINGISDYTIDSGAATSLVLFADDASQLPAVTAPTFSITASETVLVEDEGTTTTFTIQLVDGNIPDDGQIINVGTGIPFGLGDFLVSPFQGAEFNNVVPVQGFSDNSGLSLRVSAPTATITLPIFDDGDQPSDDPNARNEDVGVEQVTFSILSGDGYNVDANAGSVELTLADTRSQLSGEPTVSFSATPTTISEAEGNALVMNFSVSGDIPPEGITVKLEGDAARIMQQFTAAQTRFNDAGETFNRFDKGLVNNNVVGGTLELFSLEDGDPSESASNPEAAGDAYLTNFTFTITEPTASITIPVFDDLIEEADATYTYTLVDGDGYTVDSSANSATFTVTDGVPSGGGPTVGVNAAPTTLVESEQTAVTLTFTTQGDIPPEGVVVVLEGPPRAIAEFDINATNPRLPENETVVEGPVVTGGNIVGTNEVVGALLFRITDPTATITVPVFQDEIEEGTETLNFNLKDGELYNVDQNASAISVTIDDVPTPTVSFSTTPGLISEAEGTALVMNFSVDGDIPPEGITVNLEGDAARIMQQFTAAQTRFNDAGETFNRFDKGLVNNNVVGGTLELFSLEDGDPSESASNPEAAGDAYLTNFTFTITEPTASITIPVFDDLIEEADATYTYTLVNGDGYKVDQNANSSTFTVTDGVVGGGGPTVSVNAAPTTLIESEQTAVTLTFTAEGEIPPEGVVVALEGPPRAIAEFDINATNPRLPENETVVEGPVVTGGNIVGTNEVVGALFFRITDPTATITVPVFQDEIEEGVETLNFNLKDGELYNVNADASAVSVTIADTEPVVSFSADKTTLVESNQDFIELSFNVDGVIPAEGLPISVKVNTTDPSKLFFVDFSAGDFEFESGTANVQDPGNIWEFKGADDGTDSGLAIVKDDDIFAIVEPPYDTINLTLTQNTASIRLPILDDVITEEDETVTFTLEEGDGYQVAAENAPVTVTLKDGDPSIADGPTVSLSADFTTIGEGQDITFTISLDQAPPEEGVRILIDSDIVASTGEFAVSRPKVDTDGDGVGDKRFVEGVTLTGVADPFSLQPNEDGSGFFVTVTEQQATIKVTVADDGITEGTESFTYRVVEGEDYNASSTNGSVTFNIQDEPVPTEPASEAVQVNEDGEITGFAYNLNGVAQGEQAQVSISEEVLELTDALFDNLVGFYEVVDENGGIDTDGDGVADINPGDEGYAKAALENAVDGFALRVGGDASDNTSASDFDAVVEGGKFYAPFAIANGSSVEDFLAVNPDNNAATSIDDQVAYFAFGAANPDGVVHLQSRGNGIYGFEDLPSNLGVSDNDFNDAVFKFDFTV